MRTFDLFNDDNFSRNWVKSFKPELRIDLTHFTNFKFGTLAGLLMGMSAYAFRFILFNQVVILPLLTIPFLSWGIAMSIKEQGKKSGKQRIDYFEGIISGFATTIIANSLFAFYVIWFFAFHYTGDQYSSPFTSACCVWIAGTALGAVVTFIAMQYFKGFRFNNNIK
jgi:hypothetical protein